MFCSRGPWLSRSMIKLFLNDFWHVVICGSVHIECCTHCTLQNGSFSMFLGNVPFFHCCRVQKSREEFLLGLKLILLVVVELSQWFTIRRSNACYESQNILFLPTSPLTLSHQTLRRRVVPSSSGSRRAISLKVTWDSTK